jgi:hypothetical protein
MKPALTRFPGKFETFVSHNSNYFVLLEAIGLDPDLIYAFLRLIAIIVEDFEC